jgi:hypothetical protein
MRAALPLRLELLMIRASPRSPAQDNLLRGHNIGADRF